VLAKYRRESRTGFSLAELLIVLALLGILSAFLVPKMLVGQSTTSLTAKYNTSVRNVAFMLVTSFEEYKTVNGTIGGATGNGLSANEIASNFNYLSVVTTGQIDGLEGSSGGLTCDAGHPCYKLHNGGMLHHWGDHLCNSGTNPSGVPFDYDPDGVYGGSTTGPGKTIRLFLYSDGSLRSGGTMKANTYWSWDPATANCTNSRSSDPDPTWFTGF